VGYLKHDPLRNMPRAEISVRLGPSTSVGISPVVVTPDDLGRLVVSSCRDVVHQAGVLPGFHLVKVSQGGRLCADLCECVFGSCRLFL